ncbi:MAG TPA: YfhO family protein, partial [Ignavibacteriaceae bacterium]|nr:YfhO family protein [Ignavibacteriaceae bacterium]
ASSFSTGIIVFLYIGHVTKLNSLCMFPLIFLMLLRFKEKIRLIDFLILIIALQIFLLGFHVQIIFYTLLAVAVYFIYYFSRSLAVKDSQLRLSILKSAGVFIAASIIALLIQIDNISQIYEYTPYSTRGTESILDKASTQIEKKESNYYSYHTDWSFSPGEMTTFIIPSFFGFGNSTYKGPLSNNQPVEVNTYFGQMSFVDVAVGYMGILVFVLALFGIFTKWKEPFVRFLTILSSLALLISFGKNFPVIFDLLFYYLPFFNKFRVPSMILVLVQVSVPILAGYGIMGIISAREENNMKRGKTVKNLAFVFTILFAASLLFNGSIASWFASRVNEHAQSISLSQKQLAQQFQVLADYMSQMFVSDLLFGLGFLMLASWAAYGYINKSLSIDTLVLLFIVLTIIDLWRIDARGAKYSEPLSKENFFIEPEYIKTIKEQGDKAPYRILNLKQDSSPGSISNNANFNAYFLTEDYYGYSGIKPRAYQDIIDIMGPVNETAWRMLNVKYIITGSPVPLNQFPYLKLISTGGNTFIYENRNVLPRVYFVNKAEQKKALEILNLIKQNSFDPREIAYIEDQNLRVSSIDSTSYAEISRYSDEDIELNVSASGNNFLFAGNTFTKGWKAFIDGNETKIYKANHGFLGLVVPKGRHKILITYSPDSFYISRIVVLILSSLVMLGLLLVLFKYLNDRRKIKNAQ